MKRRWKILLVCVAIMGVTVLAGIVRHYQLKAANAAYIAELQSKGEPMELSQVVPSPIPAEQNGADIFREAVALIHSDKSLLQTQYVSGMEMVAPGKAKITWQQSEVRDFDVTNSWENVTQAVAQNQKALRLLRQIVDKPNFDFQIPYEQGVAEIDFKPLYLSDPKVAAQRLETAAICDLHSGDVRRAVENLRAMLALVKAMRSERFVISELVRMAIAQIALTVNWELLQSPGLTDQQLALLQQEWLALNFVKAEEEALLMERVTGRISAEKWRESDSALIQSFDKWVEFMQPGEEPSFFRKIRFSSKVFRWRYWWSYSDEVLMLKGYQAMLESARLAGSNYALHGALQEQEAAIERLAIKTEDSGLWFTDLEKTDLHSILSASVATMSRVLVRVMRAEATKQLAAAAIALKRYQLRHEGYPPDLDVLVPAILSAIPCDPVDGQPLRYHLNADGTFLLYSIGEDSVDDGGDPTPDSSTQSTAWQTGRDWVWPQLVTAQEVKNLQGGAR